MGRVLLNISGWKLYLTVFVLLCEIVLGASVVVTNSALPVILLMGCLVFLLFFINPLYGYLIALFFLSFIGNSFSFDLGPISLRPRDIFFPPVLLGWFLMYTFQNDKKLPIIDTPVNRPLFILGWYMALTLIWATGKGDVISKSVQYVFDLGLFFITISLIDNRKKLEKTLYAWCIGGVFISMVNIGQVFFLGGRSKGLTDSSLGLGEFLGYPLILAVFLLLTSQTTARKMITLFFSISILLGMLATQARGPMLGFVAGCVFIFCAFMHLEEYLKKIFRLLLYALFSLFGLILVLDILGMDIFSALFNEIYSRFTDVLTDEIQTNAGSVEWRVTIWSAAVKMFMTSPFLGIGIGNFQVLSTSYGLSQPEDCVHNIFLQLLTELGIVGFLIAVYLAVKLLSSYYVVYQTLEKNYDKILIIFLTAGFLSKGVRDLTFGFFIEDRAMFLFLALGFVVKQINEKEKKTHTQEGRVTLKRK